VCLLYRASCRPSWYTTRDCLQHCLQHCLEAFLIHHQRLLAALLETFLVYYQTLFGASWRPSWYTTRDCLERLCNNFDSCNRFLRALLEDCNYFTTPSILSCISYRALAIMSRKHVTKHFRMAKKVLCSMAAERKLVSNSQSLCNIHWIYTAL